MVEYKSISTHLFYWPTWCSKTILPKAFHSSISGTLFSNASLLSCDGSVKNKHDIFRLTRFKWVKILR